MRSLRRNTIPVWRSWPPYEVLKLRTGITKLIIMKLLSEEGELSGYDLVKKIKKLAPFWNPSPGCIYPILKSLEEQGIISGRDVEGKRVYSLTEEGKKAFEDYCKTKEDLLKRITTLMNVLSKILNSEELREISYILVPIKASEEDKIIIKMEKEAIQVFASKIRKLLQNGRKEEAKKYIEELQKIASKIDV